MKSNFLQIGVGVAAGLLFALGLSLGGMTSPDVVRSFLDLGGPWSPKPALVLIGALTIYVPAYWLVVPRMRSPFGSTMFEIPQSRRVDRPLLLGAALFGAGWAIAGWCPGPALVAAATVPKATVFVAVMIASSYAVAAWLKRGRP